MSAFAAVDWSEFNQTGLQQALAEIRACLSSAQEADRAAAGSAFAADAECNGDTAIDALCQLFQLSRFERSCLLLCAGVELDSGFAADCLAADPQGPTFALALATLPEPHWSAITPVAPLRQWRLLEPEPSGSPTRSRLRIDERILHYLLGIDYLDERLQGLLAPLQVSAGQPQAYGELIGQLSALWQAESTIDEPARVYLRCAGSGPAHALAAQAGLAMGLNVYRLRSADLPDDETGLAETARLWEREYLLAGGMLLIDEHDLPADDRRHTGRRFVERCRIPLLISGDTELPTDAVTAQAVVQLDVPPLSHDEQRRLWQTVLGEAGSRLSGELDELLMQFELDEQRIVRIGRQLDSEDVGGGIAAEDLWRHCRVQSRQGMARLAERIEPVATWEDLVLPPAQRDILLTISAQMRHRARVYRNWGFAAKTRRGLGISALFSGPSGTGKTMAAEVLANELELDLHRIDLSQVVSKYIGETEKNLRRVFDAAEQGGAILLFDEADALFGKRSDVKDSHDRYANIEISYLLQRMETYRGLAILTTNLKENLDPAFVRRLRFIVRFPFPDMAHRAEIWRRIFPQDTPRHELDPERLAQLNVPGGNIRNIALNAAFLAADGGASVGMAQVLQAARSEYAKLEKTLNDAEIRGWL